VGGRWVASNGVGWTGRIEYVFDELVTGDQVAGADDGTLIDAITGWARAEATVTAHRLAAIAELAGRRCGAELAASREQWACDGWDSAAAEIAAALTIGHRAAGTQMLHALRLRDRLPRVGALLAEAMITAATAATVGWRTLLVEDPQVMARIDADLAGAAARFAALSAARLETAIDTIIVFHDPAAVRRFHSAARGRDITIGDPEDTTGTTSIWGRLHATDAELLKRRLDALAHSVCPADPRTLGERRSDALGILGAHGDRLPCRCEKPDCPAAGPDARADRIVIHVLTDQHPDTPPPDPNPNPGPEGRPDGDGGGPRPEPGPDPDSDHPGPDPGPDSGSNPDPDTAPTPTDSGTPAAPDPDVDPAAESVDSAAVSEANPPAAFAATPAAPAARPAGCPATAVIAGGPAIPAALLSELRRLGVAVRPVPTAERLGAEPGYRPSTALQRFIRNRDLTCCFPGCHHPAEYCDLDHTRAYATSRLTHPGNLKCLCRKHHLLNPRDAREAFPPNFSVLCS